MQSIVNTCFHLWVLIIIDFNYVSNIDRIEDYYWMKKLNKSQINAIN
jgi:hypothetical protein